MIGSALNSFCFSFLFLMKNTRGLRIKQINLPYNNNNNNNMLIQMETRFVPSFFVSILKTRVNMITGARKKGISEYDFVLYNCILDNEQKKK